MHTCTKRFDGFAAAHRQHRHDGHCALIHGHNWSFEFTFEALELDENEFVLDFGKLKWLKAYLTEQFDHTLLLNEDDPQLVYLRSVLDNGPCAEGTVLAHIVVVPNCGAEGLAKYLHRAVDSRLANPVYCPEAEDYIVRQVRVLSVVVWEDDKNSAAYTE